MKTETQDRAELAPLAQMIEPFSIAMLTTLDCAGILVSRPMTIVEMDRAGELWCLTDVRSAKVDHVALANLCFTDPLHSIYVSLAVSGEIHAVHVGSERFWTAQASEWFPDGPESKDLALLKLAIVAADYWDAGTHRMNRWDVGINVR